MPKVTLKFNCSRGCALVHHGHSPDTFDERVELMRPFAEAFATVQSRTRPDWTLDLAPEEMTDDQWLLFPSQPSEGVNRENIQWLVDVVCEVNADVASYLAADANCIEAMTPAVLSLLRRASRMTVGDPLRAMSVLDEVLVTVDDAAPIFPLDVMAYLGTERGLGCVTLVGDEEWRPVGMVVCLYLATSVGIVAHEAAHVLNIARGHPDVDPMHGPQFAAALSEVLTLMESTGCMERVSGVFSSGVPDLPACRHRWDIADGGRWRLGLHEGAAYATWRREGADHWGVATVDNDRFLSSLSEAEEAFALFSVGRHHSQTKPR